MIINKRRAWTGDRANDVSQVAASACGIGFSAFCFIKPSNIKYLSWKKLYDRQDLRKTFWYNCQCFLSTASKKAEDITVKTIPIFLPSLSWWRRYILGKEKVEKWIYHQTIFCPLRPFIIRFVFNFCLLKILTCIPKDEQFFFWFQKCHLSCYNIWRGVRPSQIYYVGSTPVWFRSPKKVNIILSGQLMR